MTTQTQPEFQNMPTTEKPDGFSNAQSTAEEFAQDKNKTSYLLEEALERAEKYKHKLEHIWQDLQALIRLVKSWTRGEYKEVPWQTIVFAIAGIVYFVNPFDVVPDFIPGAGLLDDATVIGFVIKSINKEIEQFLEWEKAANEKVDKQN